MKKIYIIPSARVIRMTECDSLLLTASEEAGSNSLLGNGGGTEGSGITSGDVKYNSYSVWDDDWSK